MVLQCDWAQIQVIVLTNDGNGFGFGISGSRNSGAVVRNIFPGGAADRDGTLQNGDHLLAVGDVRLWGMGAEQVASILRQAGQDSIRLVVARPIDPSVPQFAINSTIIPTKVLTDPIELERTLESGLQTPNGYIFEPIANPCDINLTRLPDSTTVAAASAAFAAAPIIDIIQPQQPSLPVSQVPKVPPNPSESSTSSSSLKDNPPTTMDSTQPNPPSPQSVTPVNTVVTQTSSSTKVSVLPDKTKAVVHDIPKDAPQKEEKKRRRSKISQDDIDGILSVVETTSEESASKNYLSSVSSLGNVLPEKEEYSIELTKDSNGLGITVAGYICEKEDLCGIFVKSVIEGSMADRSGCIMVNDQVIEVDGISLAGYTNHEAVEILKKTASIVKLKIIRYLRGLKFEELREGGGDGGSTDPSRAETEVCDDQATSLPLLTKTSSFGNNQTMISLTSEDRASPPLEDPCTKVKQSSSSYVLPQPRSPCGATRHSVPEIALRDDLAVVLNQNGGNNENPLSASSVDGIDGRQRRRLSKMFLENEKESEDRKRKKWEEIMGSKFTIVIARLKKSSDDSGLGISLEGTVDVEDGREVRPHHYIRSVLPNGPIGKHGGLQTGDELLEANGKSLKGLFHEDVVKTLKELPLNVCLVCARKNFSGPSPIRGTIVDNVDPGKSEKAFQSRKILSGSLQSLLALKEPEVQLIKAKSEVSLAFTNSASLSVPLPRCSDSRSPSSRESISGSRKKARSLDPLIDKPAMWSMKVEEILLNKTEKGLGFSILDYQDPMNSSETVIVVRSLVPGGVAQMSGKIVPGDRIMYVSDVRLEHSSLDTAVQVLKGAPLGPVRIGISRPLPQDGGENDAGPSNTSEGVAVYEPSGRPAGGSASTNEGESDLKTEYGSIPTRESWTGDDDTIPDHEGGSGHNSFSSSSSAFYSNAIEINRRELEPVMNYPILVDLPKYRIRVKKTENESLGLQLEALAFELSGTVVRAVDPRGSIAKDGNRLGPGDLILNLNEESLWRVTSSQAKSILRRADLCANVPIVFVPEEDLVAADEGNLREEGDESNEEEQSLSQSLSTKLSQDEEIVPDLTVQSASLITRFPSDLLESSVDPPHLLKNTATSSSSTLNEEKFSDRVFDHPKDDMVRIYQPPPDVRRSANSSSDGLGVGALNGKTSPGTLSSSSSMTFGASLNTPKSSSKTWGPEKCVEIMRIPGSGLGISIVGGKVDVSGSEKSSGIFIKNVLPDSPAGRTGKLCTGDRVIEVGGVKLSSSDHETAVKAIKNAGNPVVFVVQSLVPVCHVTAPTQSINETPEPSSPVPSSPVPSSPVRPNQDQSYNYEYKNLNEVPVSPVSSKNSNLLQADDNDYLSSAATTPPGSPEIIQTGLSHLERQAIQQKIRAEIKAKKEEHLTVYKKNSLDVDNISDADSISMEISSSRHVGTGEFDAKKLKALDDKSDAEASDEDDTQYRNEAVNKSENFKCLQGEVIEVRLKRDATFGFGMALSGHRDRNRMGTYICGIHPEGPAKDNGKLMIGDEIVKFHKSVVRGRCHLNVSAIIKKCPEDIAVRIIVIRNKDNHEKIAIRKVSHFPSSLEDTIFKAPEFSKYRAKREIKMQKTTEGLGIMLIEGHHKVTGKGIFVSDIQEGSLANKGGLKVGDMLLAVNTESFLEITYDQAVAIIKNLTGIIRMLVTNPQEAAKEVEDEASGKIKPPEQTLEVATPSKSGAVAVSEIPEPSPIKSAPSPAKVPTPAKSPTPVVPPKTPAKTPAKSPAKAVDDSKIEIKTDSSGLGVSILGGKDTPLGGIVVDEIYGNGAAEKDGRLLCGDRLVSINGKVCSGLTHNEAVKLIRSNIEKVTFVVDRKTPKEDAYEDVEVELTKKSGKGFGLSVVGKNSGPGIYISDLVIGGIAETSGALYRGDQIISINDKDISQSVQGEAVAVLKTTTGNVKMKVRRLKAFK